ncbi:MAG TPA: branched-chain amino acid ABC transporter permease [Anaeromyxobacter sp.]
MQQAVNGLFLGSIYALFALGYTLVFGVLDILNLAHAAVFMLASFGALTLVGRGLHILAAFPLAVLLAGVLGLVLERIAFRPLRGRTDSNISGLISSLAMATVFVALALQIWGPNVTRFPFATLPSGRPISFLGAGISRLQLTTMGVALLFFLALWWLVTRTRLGREIRAVAESPRAARILGVNVDRVIAASFFISSALGGAAGVLFGLAYDVEADMGRSVELKGLAVIILGGMGSMPGAVLAGLTLGLTEAFVVARFGASYRDAISFAGLFLILVLRPRGLLGQAALREA